MKRGAMLVLLFFGVLLGAVWARTETVLYSFCEQNNCTDGAEPVAGIVFDQKGNLYGTTRAGGAYQYCSDVGFGCGVVFKLTRAGKYTLLHTFCEQGGNCTDGANPFAALVFDPKGNLYGTTEYGGVHGQGVVFKLTPEGQYAVLHNFCARNNCTDGYDPSSGLALDQKGNLYGTTAYGGANGGGVVFKLTPDGKYTVLHSFCQQGYPCTDGTAPRGGLVLDQGGNLYGTTLLGGGVIGYCSDVGYGCGVVFKLTPKGKATVLYSFCAQSNCTDGASPYAGLVFDQKGNLYGTTTYGGANCSPSYGCGVVFKLTPKGKETVLYDFCAQTGCPDGNGPSAGGLVFDQKGNLYGTTLDGGTPSCNDYSGCGVTFKLTPKGKETVLYSFCPQWPSCTDGDYPLTGLVFDQKGNLYGTALDGGHGGGVIFKLTP